MPPLPESERRVELPASWHADRRDRTATRRCRRCRARSRRRRNAGVPVTRVVRELVVTLLPALFFAVADGR